LVKIFGVVVDKEPHRRRNTAKFNEIAIGLLE
jgi:hypothetical protein